MTRAGRLIALPLVLLALLLQFGAAVAATRAQADAAGNPFAAVPICSPDSPRSEAGGKGPAGQHGADHCPSCLIGAVAQPAILASAEVAVPCDRSSVAAPALADHRLPRGPPERAPKARGPPAFA